MSRHFITSKFCDTIQLYKIVILKKKGGRGGPRFGPLDQPQPESDKCLAPYAFKRAKIS